MIAKPNPSLFLLGIVALVIQGSCMAFILLSEKSPAKWGGAGIIAPLLIYPTMLILRNWPCWPRKHGPGNDSRIYKRVLTDEEIQAIREHGYLFEGEPKNE